MLPIVAARAQRLANVLLPPLILALFLNAAFEGAARHVHHRVSRYDTWIKWDSGHYLSIATTGYEFMSCAEVPGYDPSQWCGNSGWFPGYPYLLRGVHAVTGVPTILLAIVVSQIFTVVDLLLVWNVFLERRDPAVLVLCAFAPGTYYFLVGFPISMVVACILVALWALRARRYRTAFVAGALAGLTYPSGLWLAGVAGASLAVAWWRGRGWPARAWAAVAGPVVGFGLVLLIQQAAVGHWNAFFLTQAKYGHTLSNPVAVLWDRSRYVWAWAIGWPIGLQSLVAAALVATVTVLAVRAVRRQDDAPGEVALGVHGLVYWIVPLLIGAGLSSYRAESLLMPAFTGLRRLHPAVLVALMPPLVVIWIVMAMQFIEGSLV